MWVWKERSCSQTQAGSSEKILARASVALRARVESGWARRAAERGPPTQPVRVAVGSGWVVHQTAGGLLEGEEEGEVLHFGLGLEVVPEGAAEDEGEAADGAHAEAGEGVGDGGRERGGEGDGVGVEDAEGKGDDAAGRVDGAGGGVGGDLAGAPVDAGDGGAEAEVDAELVQAVGEEVRKAAVAFADAEDAVAVGGVFGLLLAAEGEDAGLLGVGGVEAFEVADGGGAGFAVDVFVVEVGGE